MNKKLGMMFALLQYIRGTYYFTFDHIMKNAYIYIMSNKFRTTFYIGVTNDLWRRVAEHNEGIGSKFVQNYKLFDLVYYEHFSDIRFAIMREKQLKNWHRAWKLNLIKKMNPGLEDLKINLCSNLDSETSSE